MNYSESAGVDAALVALCKMYHISEMVATYRAGESIGHAAVGEKPGLSELFTELSESNLDIVTCFRGAPTHAEDNNHTKRRSGS